jgi:hypothetical protein
VPCLYRSALLRGAYQEVATPNPFNSCARGTSVPSLALRSTSHPRLASGAGRDPAGSAEVQAKLRIFVQPDEVGDVGLQQLLEPRQVLLCNVHVEVVQGPARPMQVPREAARELVTGRCLIKNAAQSADRTFLRLGQRDAADGTNAIYHMPGDGTLASKGAKNNYVSQSTGGGQSGQTISTNHFPKGDSRLSWASTRSMASLVRVTPVRYVVVTSSTTG